MSQTAARRLASREYHERLKLEGFRKETFWLSPAAQKKLTELAVIHGSRNAAIEALLGSQ